MAKELFTCCFCGHKFPTKEMNNAEPVIKNGKCCNDCNQEKVIPHRLGLLLYSVYRA